jgi:ammonium transporter, Amt family
VNGSNLLLKNFLQFSLAFVVWWLVGYAFALGDVDSKYIGEERFGGRGWLFETTNYPPSYFGLIGIFVLFIINGAISEKAQYVAYPVTTFWIMIVIWPTIVAWVWGDSGWLNTELDSPIKDYGFTITIYVFAGAFSFIAALLTGRRLGRFSHHSGVHHFRMQSHLFYYLGALLLIIGIFVLNNDLYSTATFSSRNAFGNTWLAGSASSIVSLKLLTVLSVDLPTHFTAVYQGFIAGMVIISSAGNCNAWEAVFWGMAAGLVFALGVRFLRWLALDDPLNVVPTFYFPGLIGGVLPGFIDNQYGVFWGGSNGFLLETKVVGVVVVSAWATFWAVVIFGLLRAFGLLVLSDEIQKEGLEKTVLTQSGWKLPAERETQ